MLKSLDEEARQWVNSRPDVGSESAMTDIVNNPDSYMVSFIAHLASTYGEGYDKFCERTGADSPENICRELNRAARLARAIIEMENIASVRRR